MCFSQFVKRSGHLSIIRNKALRSSWALSIQPNLPVANGTAFSENSKKKTTSCDIPNFRKFRSESFLSFQLCSRIFQNFRSEIQLLLDFLEIFSRNICSIRHHFQIFGTFCRMGSAPLLQSHSLALANHTATLVSTVVYFSICILRAVWGLLGSLQHCYTSHWFIHTLNGLQADGSCFVRCF